MGFHMSRFQPNQNIFINNFIGFPFKIYLQLVNYQDLGNEEADIGLEEQIWLIQEHRSPMSSLALEIWGFSWPRALWKVSSGFMKLPT